MLDEHEKVALADALEQMEQTREEAARDEQLVGLNLFECVNDLVHNPELLPRVRKIVCEEWPGDKRITPVRREILEQLEGKLYFPRREGRQHQLPQGNPYHGHPAYEKLPSKWWITNLAYRKVLIHKLRALAQALRGR